MKVVNQRSQDRMSSKVMKYQQCLMILKFRTWTMMIKTGQAKMMMRKRRNKTMIVIWRRLSMMRRLMMKMIAKFRLNASWLSCWKTELLTLSNSLLSSLKVWEIPAISESPSQNGALSLRQERKILRLSYLRSIYCKIGEMVSRIWEYWSIVRTVLMVWHTNLLHFITWI